MKSVRGRIKSYLKYIGRMNSFFYSIAFYGMSTGDQIPWRFRIHKNNLCPCPGVLWVITPSVSSVTPNRVSLHVTCIYKSRQLYLALPLRQCCAGHQRNYKDERVRWDTYLPHNMLRVTREEYLLWTTNLVWKPAVKFELGPEIHFPFYFSSFVSVLIPK